MKSDTCIPIEKDSPDSGAFAACCSGALRREESLLKQILRDVYVNVNSYIKTEGVQMPDVRSPGVTSETKSYYPSENILDDYVLKVNCYDTE